MKKKKKSRRKLSPKEHAENQLVDELVFKYQAGDDSSGEELLRRFGAHPEGPMTNYLGKFYNLLRYTRVNFSDKDTRGFISLLIDDKEIRDKLKPFYQYAEVKAKSILAVEKLRAQCSVIPNEELKQEMRIIFLRLARRYKKKSKNVYFTAYLKKSFRYRLLDYINKTIVNPQEPYLHKRKKMIYLNDDTHYNEETLVKLDERAFTESPIMKFDDELGNSWVRGITCSDEFRKLTPLQRLIIRMSFYEGRSDREIAERTALHINTINRNKLKAVKMVKEEWERLYGRND